MGAIPAGDHYPKTGMFHAMQYRNYRLFFYGQLISVAGTWMQDVAMKWLVWELTHDPRWLGIVAGANAIPFVLFAMWGGHIADRYPRRDILVWTQTGAMILAFVLALLASPFSPVALVPWHIAVISVLAGIINAFNMPAQQSFVTDIVEDRKVLSNAIALNSLRFNIARVLGPMLAGIVLIRYKAATCFFLNGLSFIAVIISLLLMSLPAFERKERAGSIFDSFRYIAETRSILRVMALIAISSIFTWPMGTIFPVFADAYHQGKAGFSGMTTANGLGAALAGLALASILARVPAKLKIYGGSAIFSLSLILFAVSRHFALALAILVLSGFAMIVFGISSQVKVQEEVPDSLRGRVMAVYSLVFNGFFSLGGIEIGWLANHLQPSSAVMLNGVIALIATIGLFVWSLFDNRS